MRREELRDERGGLVALALHAGDDAPDWPPLETSAAWRGLVRITLHGAPLLWARVWSDHYGWTWLPARESPAIIAPMRADDARSIATRAPFGSDAWWSAWSFRLAGDLGALTSSRRTPLVWLVPLDRHAPIPGLGAVLPFEPGDHWWDHRPATIPSRAWPEPDHARVRAYRRLTREHALPPVLTVWCSALQSHLVLDGHARLVAARGEGVDPPVLSVVRMAPRAQRDDARARERLASTRAALETLAASDVSGANLAALEAARITARLGERPPVQWQPIDRASPVSRARWLREVRRALGDRRDPIASELRRR